MGEPSEEEQFGGAPPSGTKRGKMVLPARRRRGNSPRGSNPIAHYMTTNSAIVIQFVATSCCIIVEHFIEKFCGIKKFEMLSKGLYYNIHITEQFFNMRNGRGIFGN